MTTTKGPGRPATSTPEKKREQAKARKQKFDRKQKLIRLISARLLDVKAVDRQIWLEFLAWAMECGDDLLVGVEWEHGGSTRKFSDIAAEELGEKPGAGKGKLQSLSFA